MMVGRVCEYKILVGIWPAIFKQMFSSEFWLGKIMVREERGSMLN